MNAQPSLNRRRVWSIAAATTGCAGLATVASALVGSMRPTPATRDAHRLSIDFGHLKPGEHLEAEFMNQPVLVMRRNIAMITALHRSNPSLLDPESNASRQPQAVKNPLRSMRPEIFVVHPVCTHLGCKVSPRLAAAIAVAPSPGEVGTFRCPCHAAVFDLAGRVYKNMPAPVNLVVPEHEFTGRNQIELWVSPSAA
jgi:ubiquinol-cytochrome c reductase iron-sulfur subunit